jgi:hypothetical protein
VTDPVRRTLYACEVHTGSSITPYAASDSFIPFSTQSSIPTLVGMPSTLCNYALTFHANDFGTPGSASRALTIYVFLGLCTAQSARCDDVGASGCCVWAVRSAASKYEIGFDLRPKRSTEIVRTIVTERILPRHIPVSSAIHSYQILELQIGHPRSRAPIDIHHASSYHPISHRSPPIRLTHPRCPSSGSCQHSLLAPLPYTSSWTYLFSRLLCHLTLPDVPVGCFTCTPSSSVRHLMSRRTGHEMVCPAYVSQSETDLSLARV